MNLCASGYLRIDRVDWGKSVVDWGKSSDAYLRRGLGEVLSPKDAYLRRGLGEVREKVLSRTVNMTSYPRHECSYEWSVLFFLSV